jgi:PAT family beta-lactamase induction signal transducer AmpG
VTDAGAPAAGRLPALSENLTLRYVAFTLLYAAQGLPYGLLSIAVPAYMAEQGLTPSQIGSYMGIILLPWSLKLINGPIMDRWSFLAMGRRRPWVLLAQAGMVATSVVMAFTPDPL